MQIIVLFLSKEDISSFINGFVMLQVLRRKLVRLRDIMILRKKELLRLLGQMAIPVDLLRLLLISLPFKKVLHVVDPRKESVKT